MAFGNINLFSGIGFTVALIGLFSIPQAMSLIENSHGAAKVASRATDRLIQNFGELKALMPNILRSSGIGVIVGLIPGTGGDTASWFVHKEAKRFAKARAASASASPPGSRHPRRRTMRLSVAR